MVSPVPTPEIEPVKEKKREKKGIEQLKHMEERPLPLLPQRFNKTNKDTNYKMFFDIFKKLHINIHLVDVLMDMPQYAKLKRDMTIRRDGM